MKYLTYNQAYKRVQREIEISQNAPLEAYEHKLLTMAMQKHWDRLDKWGIRTVYFGYVEEQKKLLDQISKGQVISL